MTVHLRWPGGGDARIVAIRPDAITLDSTVPAPPGSRIEGTLVADQGTPLRVRIKVHGSKRQDDGRFVIEGRPIDLSREVRAVLESVSRS